MSLDDIYHIICPFEGGLLFVGERSISKYDPNTQTISQIELDIQREIMKIRE